MIVDLSELANAMAYLQKVNSVPLDSIEWMDRGEAVEPDALKVAQWKFVGLNNTSFAATHLMET